MKNISQTISWVFNPLILPTYTIALLFYTPTYARQALDIKDNIFEMNDRLKWVFIALFFFILFLAPLGSLLIMKKNEQIESIELNHRKERFWPILITGFYSLILFFILYKQLNTKYFSFIFHAIALLGIVSSVFAYLSTRLFKISLHALGVGMTLGIVIFQYMHFYIDQPWTLIGVVLLGGIIMSARYYLKKHNLAQLLSGYTMGITLSLFVLIFSRILL